MPRTRLQLDADRRAADLRRRIADDLRRLRLDAGASQAAVANLAGIDRSVLTRLEAGTLSPTLETYVRLAAALGADYTARLYPNTGPAIHDRHHVRMADAVIGAAHERWTITPEVAVRRPARGWIDLALHDPRVRLVIATELESDLRRIEQLIRWSTEKAASIDSSTMAREWLRDGVGPDVSRLLVARWTRTNRDVAAAARRLLREAYPADPRDALEAITGTATWPGAALVWARIDRGRSELVA
jgi:transcriptional regulator with XRE-family HTH domain